MVDTTQRDLINAEQNIKGALNEKKEKFERDNKYLHVMSDRTYNNRGLYTIISIIAATITLFFSILVSRDIIIAKRFYINFLEFNILINFIYIAF